MRGIPFYASVFMACTMAIADGAIIGYEDFDGGAVNLTGTSNVFDYGSGGGFEGDVFGRVSSSTGMSFGVADDSVADVSGGGAFPTDSVGLVGQNGSAFFAMDDADGIGVNNATWSFDISGAISLTSISMNIGAMGDFEAVSDDGFLVQIRIDGGSFINIFEGITDEDAVKTYRPLDSGLESTLNDPLELLIDGVATGIYLDKSDPDTGLFDTFTSNAVNGLSGNTLDIRISWAGTPSGTEPMGFDDFTITGVIPEPSTVPLLVLAGAIVLGTRRRRWLR